MTKILPQDNFSPVSYSSKRSQICRFRFAWRLPFSATQFILHAWARVSYVKLLTCGTSENQIEERQFRSFCGRTPPIMCTHPRYWDQDWKWISPHRRFLRRKSARCGGECTSEQRWMAPCNNTKRDVNNNNYPLAGVPRARIARVIGITHESQTQCIDKSINARKSVLSCDI